MIIELETGHKLEVPDGSTPQQIDEIAGHFAQQVLKSQAQAQGNAAGPGNAGVYGAVDMVPGGNSLTSAIGAAGAKLAGADQSFGDLYSQAKADTTATEQAHPGATALGNVAGIAATIPLAGPAAKAVGKGLNAIPGIATATSKAANIVRGGKSAADASRLSNTVVSAAKGATLAAPVGAIYGADAAKPGEELAGAKQGALVGGVAGAALPVAGAALGAIGSAAIPKIEPKTAALAQRAQDMGINLRLDQISPTRVRKTVQKVSQEIPGSGVDAQETAQRQQWNAALAKTIGQDSPDLGPETIQNFIQDANTKFSSAIGTGDIKFSQKDMAALGDIVSKSKTQITGDLVGIVKSNVDKFIKDANFSVKTGTVIPAQKLASLRSQIIKDLPTIQGGAKQQVAKIVDVIDNVVQGQITPEAQATLTQARKEWRNFKTIEPLLEKSTDGQINPTDLMQRVASSKYIKSSRAPVGEDDLVDLARIGKQFLPKAGGSDTTQKAALVLAAKKAGSLGGAITSAAVVGPIKTGLALGANRALQRGYNSNSKLVNLALKNSGKIPKSLPNVSPLTALAAGQTNARLSRP